MRGDQPVGSRGNPLINSSTVPFPGYEDIKLLVAAFGCSSALLDNILHYTIGSLHYRHAHEAYLELNHTVPSYW